MTYKANIPYLGTTVQVEADDFAKLHEAIAGINELNRSMYYLQKRCGENCHPAPSFRQIDGNDFYEVVDSLSGKKVSFGTYKEKGRAIPFFPKTEEGYFDPAEHKGGKQ